MNKKAKPIIKNCILCKGEVEMIYPEKFTKGHREESCMWSGGLVDKISANYGSAFDSNMYLIALCDKCIKYCEASGSIEYVGNYMFPDEHNRELEKL